jgi:hypothetical protein
MRRIPPAALCEVRGPGLHGTIDELEQLDSTRTIGTFEVDRVWKGNLGRQIVLHQALEGIDSFRLIGASTGSKYLVFATRLNAQQRQRSNCRNARTRSASRYAAAGHTGLTLTTRRCDDLVEVESHVEWRRKMPSNALHPTAARITCDGARLRRTGRSGRRR